MRQGHEVHEDDPAPEVKRSKATGGPASASGLVRQQATPQTKEAEKGENKGLQKMTEVKGNTKVEKREVKAKAKDKGDSEKERGQAEVKGNSQEQGAVEKVEVKGKAKEVKGGSKAKENSKKEKEKAEVKHNPKDKEPENNTKEKSNSEAKEKEKGKAEVKGSGKEKEAEDEAVTDREARALEYEKSQAAMYEQMDDAALETARRRALAHPMFREFMVDLIGDDRVLQKEFYSEYGTIEPVEELVSFDSFVWSKIEDKKQQPERKSEETKEKSKGDGGKAKEKSKETAKGEATGLKGTQSKARLIKCLKGGCVL